MKTTTSVRSFATALNHDLTAGNFPLPSEMVEMLECATTVPEDAAIAQYACDAYAVTTARLPKATSNWSRISFAPADPMRSIAKPLTTRERAQLTALRTPSSPKGIVARLVAAQAEAATEANIPLMVANGYVEIEPNNWIPLKDHAVYPQAPDQPEERVTRSWALMPDELKSSIFSTLNDLHGLEAWKAEQTKVRAAQSSTFRINTEKVVTPAGTREWDNAIVRQFPPLTVLRDKSGVVLPSEGVIHVPARYVVQLPHGKWCDLGRSQGQWQPILHNAPDAAMRSVATRLKLDVKGGAATIIAHIWGLDNVVPTYQTIWRDAPWLDTIDENGLPVAQGWMVIVGYERNRSTTLSSYLASEDGDIIKATGDIGLTPVQVENFTERLTVSQAEYRILSRANIASADGETAVEEDGVIIDEYMELDAELIDQGFQRDGERFTVDADQITGGMLLVEEAARIMQPKNFERLSSYGTTDMLNDFYAGVPVWECDGFRDALAVMANNVRKENHALTRRIAAMKGPISSAMMAVFNAPEGSVEHADAREWLKMLQKRKEALIARKYGSERVRDLAATDADGNLIVGGKLEMKRHLNLTRDWFEARADLNRQTLLPRSCGHWAGRFDAKGSPVLENKVIEKYIPQTGFQTTRPGLDPKATGAIPSPSRHESDAKYLELDPELNAPFTPEHSHKVTVASEHPVQRFAELFSTPALTRTVKRPTKLTQAQREEHAERLAIKHAKRINHLRQQAHKLVSIKNRAIQERDWNNCLANQSGSKDNAATGRKWTLNSDQALRFW